MTKESGKIEFKQEYFWKGYIEDKVYPVSQLTEFLENAKNSKIDIVKPRRGLEYYNIPSSFDIETSSFELPSGAKNEPTKFSCMYIWQFGLNGSVIYGRSWEEFGNFLQELVD